MSVYYFQVSNRFLQLQHLLQQPLRLLSFLPEYWRMAMTVTAMDNVMDRMSMLGV